MENAAVAAVAPRPSPADRKRELAEARNRLRVRYLETGSVSGLLEGHSRLVDETLKTVWRELAPPSGVSLLAVGGYGRGELYPCSDIDLLFLLPAAADAALASKLETVIGLLWDIGLEVGHSVRTVAQCLEESAKDITVQTNLLEARLVAGNRGLFREFEAVLQGALDPADFFNAKQLEQQQRHLKFHDTAYNLEPNIKESPGGLRDLQTVLWIAGAGGFGNSWARIARQGLITRDEARQIAGHERWLQNLRVRLHYLANRREDRLLFDVQTNLARDLGFADRGFKRASEHLMQRYYRTAKAVSQLSLILLLNLKARLIPGPGGGERRVLNDRFVVANELLDAARESVFEEQPAAILESFLLLQKRPELKGMSPACLRRLWLAGPRINAAFRRDPANRALFMEILRQPRGITHELRRMNQCGVLGHYVPAFGRIVGQMQHDLFHVYTVDEHILMVVRNLRRFTVAEFAHEFPLCSRLINEFERPEVLYLAGLFHDIAKGRGGDHSLLGSRDARRFCREHGLPDQDARLVEWLVENHLVMSATAQKQDLSNMEVISAFAQKVGSDRRLAALYLLTVADIRGTSPKIWNAWKGKLLEDLFWATRRMLSGAQGTAAGLVETRQSKVLDLLRLYAIPSHAHERLWSQLDTAYFLRHDAQEIAWHTRLLNYRVNTPDPVIKARLSPAGEGVQVLIYTPDQKDLFARICSFFERIGFSIIEAKIYTTRHGYALDSFLVMEAGGESTQYRDLLSFIEYELAERLRKQTPLEPPLQGRVSRQLKHFPITPEVLIRPDERGNYHILSIVAGDRPGLLSRIARALVKYGVNLESAKIVTLGARAEDTFLISGEALADSKAVIRLESDLLEALQPESA
ncbi:MAG: [protein-PII] uridylyltransferase [Betaproteobacteria bacterium]|nr:[protein-PII] uridylyltransferase [Betaproteobacteria bacterium]